MNEYRVSPKDSGFGVVFEDKTDEAAIQHALDLVEYGTIMGYDRWVVTQVIRGGDPDEDTAVDDKGRHHEILVTEIMVDKEVGYVKVIE